VGVTAADRLEAGVTGLLSLLDDASRAQACLPFEDPEAGAGDERRHWSYLPGVRRGLALHEMSREQAQAALRLVAAALASHAFAALAAVLALEDVLDLSEGGSGRRHRGDYWVAVFGEPGADAWGWRFEGHHVSVNLSIVRGSVRAMPLFLGANPAVVRSTAGAVVLRPLAEEEEAARGLLEALPASARRVALLSDEAPRDLLTERRPAVELPDAVGVAGAELPPDAAALLDRLLAVYLSRLRPDLVGAQVPAAEASFAWRGSLQRGAPHYYQLTAPGLLVEYDNTQNGANHIHSVVRDPRGDFGADLLAEHYRARHA